MGFSEPLRRVVVRMRASVEFAESGDVTSALEATSRCHRALTMLAEAASLTELARAVAAERAEAWSHEAIDRVVERIDAVEDAVVVDGAIDRDFSPPSVRKETLPLLSSARQFALAIGGMDARGCAAALRAAAETLSLAAGRC